MASHKLKNYRFRIIDSCLTDRSRKWSLQNIIDEVSLRLYNEFGVKKVSKRTIQYDIALMREEPPKGFNAPIICIEGYYYYADEDFSIGKSQLSKPDVDNLNEAARILRQYKDYSHIGDIHKIIEKIESITTINPGPGSDMILFEKQTNQSLNKTWITKLYEAIEQKQVLEITVNAANEGEYTEYIIHPYLLREYRNNWYLYGHDENKQKLSVIPLSTIAAVAPKIISFFENDQLETGDYFDKLIGIEPSENQKTQTVKLWFHKDVADLIVKEPLHQSQEIISNTDAGCVLTLKLMPNKDFEELLLSYGPKVKVEAPETLRKKVLGQLKEAYESYFKLSLF